MRPSRTARARLVASFLAGLAGGLGLAVGPPAGAETHVHRDESARSRTPEDPDARSRHHDVTVQPATAEVADTGVVRDRRAAAALALAAGIGLASGLRRRRRGRLVFLEGARRGESIPLRRARTRIGALHENDLVVDSHAVSRYHAEIRSRRGSAEVRDLGSSNGTRVNGTAVLRCPLEPGDRLRIGDVDLRYER